VGGQGISEECGGRAGHQRGGRWEGRAGSTGLYEGGERSPADAHGSDGRYAAASPQPPWHATDETGTRKEAPRGCPQLGFHMVGVWWVYGGWLGFDGAPHAYHLRGALVPADVFARLPAAEHLLDHCGGLLLRAAEVKLHAHRTERPRALLALQTLPAQNEEPLSTQAGSNTRLAAVR